MIGQRKLTGSSLLAGPLIKSVAAYQNIIQTHRADCTPQYWDSLEYFIPC